jgi:hypothetical protein
VPVWWPAFCSTYDLGAAGALAVLLKRGDLRRRGQIDGFPSEPRSIHSQNGHRSER